MRETRGRELTVLFQISLNRPQPKVLLLVLSALGSCDQVAYLIGVEMLLPVNAMPMPLNRD